MKKYTYIFLIFSAMLLSSCLSNKRFFYLQDKSKTDLQTDTSSISKIPNSTYLIHTGDILYMNLYTSDEQLNKLFNPTAAVTATLSGIGSQYYFTGFYVDNNGFVDFPYVGKINVNNQTLEQAKESIETEVRKYFKVFSLTVKIAEFKFSIMGAVSKPGSYFFNQNRVNLFEALAVAGDLLNGANRSEVQIMRQYPDGIKMHVIDLTDQRIMNSPLFYLQPHDLIYVRPIRSRTLGDLSNTQTSLSAILPIFTTMLTVFNTYILVKNLK